jgi:four helix bundle protein
MKNPANLLVSPKALELADTIYRLTAEFPKSEMFGLTAQMRRAAVSIGSNIYEGCGRGGDKALSAFLQIALGSATELEFQLLLAARLAFAPAAKLRDAATGTVELKKMLSRLIISVEPTPTRKGRIGTAKRDTAV